MMNAADLNECRRRVGQILQAIGEMQGAYLRTREQVSISGSQHKEDEVLAELLEPYPQATYVDVGAYWPEECSNTWKLYQKGWHGLLIEPLPTCWEMLLKKRIRDRLWPVAAGDHDGMATLRVCSSTSTMQPDWNIPSQGEILIEVERLETILARFPEIRDNCKLCSIDVEGSEAMVLSGIDWKTFKPDVFIIEYRDYGPATVARDLSNEWIHHMANNGYREVWRNDLNIIFLGNGRKAPWEEGNANPPDTG